MTSWSWFWSGTEETFVQLWVHLKVEGSSRGLHPRWAEPHLVAPSDIAATCNVSRVLKLLWTNQNPTAALPGMESELMEDFAWVQSNILILGSCDLSPVTPGRQSKQWCQGESPLWVPDLCFCKWFNDEMPFLSYIWKATNLKLQTDQKLLTNPCASSASFWHLAFGSAKVLLWLVARLSCLSEIAVLSSGSLKCVLYPAGKLDFTNPSLEQDGVFLGVLLSLISPGYFSPRFDFVFQHCPAPAILVGCCQMGFVSPSARCLLREEEEGCRHWWNSE